jgi:hypothetical protein
MELKRAWACFQRPNSLPRRTLRVKIPTQPKTPLLPKYAFDQRCLQLHLQGMLHR